MTAEQAEVVGQYVAVKRLTQLRPERTAAHPTGEAAYGRSLFVVNPGVPIEDAMESLSELLSSAGETLYATAMGERTLLLHDAWLVKHTLDAAKAVVDSLKESLAVQRLNPHGA